jgi:hypothetical protein
LEEALEGAELFTPRHAGLLRAMLDRTGAGMTRFPTPALPLALVRQERAHRVGTLPIPADLAEFWLRAAFRRAGWKAAVMDLFVRCALLLDQIADRVAPEVLATARSHGADREWEAALITVMNTGIDVSTEEEDQLNDLLAELVSIHAARHLVQVHTGMYGFDLPLTAEILDAEPAADLAAWPEVSEASVILAGPVLLIESILAGQADRLPLPAQPGQARSYRVRVHATGRAEAAEAVHVSADNGDRLAERHLIQVWPAPAEPLRTWKP